MYLRSITLINTGPIQRVNLDLPFNGDLPKPLVLVGKNGSGKSTLISFVVNALVALKQRAFEDIEVENGKVFRLRSPLGINGSENYYFAKLLFDKNVILTEWQLNRLKKDFNTDDALYSIDETWNQIDQNEISYFNLSAPLLTEKHQVEELLNKTSLLFFPADRFEPPDWLNSENLSSDLKLPEPNRVQGKTARRILSRNRLKPTLEWISSIIYDMLLHEHTLINVPLPNSDAQSFLVRMPTPGKSHAVFESIVLVLKNVIGEFESDSILISQGNRNSRIISATVNRNGHPVRTIKDLMSLSAGESALFCLFASIIRDADLSAMDFQSPADIVGIVIIDEADLHLHIGLQHDILPRLIALFPKVQFILSVHAPMVSMGLEKVLGNNGYEIREMPSGEQIDPESYSEFLSAFNVFSTTKKFQAEILAQINESVLPVLLVEGKSDAELISTAWTKLYPTESIPFEPIPCGVEPNPSDRQGGAELLRRCTEFLSIVSDRQIFAVFDFDRIGFEQFKGLKRTIFNTGIDELHKKHTAKDVQAILLPIPTSRNDFVNLNKGIHSYLSIEHYFSDDVLIKHGFVLDPVIAGSKVFEIDSGASIKIKFANEANNLDPEEFDSFKLLFKRLAGLGMKGLERYVE